MYPSTSTALNISEKQNIRAFEIQLQPIIVLFELNPNFAQKNAAGKIIIVYDEDERIASQAATIMCERGVENLFMLSGGNIPFNSGC